MNCVAAGLVERPERMPGFTFDWRLWKTGGLWVERPDGFFSDRRPERLFLRVNAPPLLYRAFDGDLDALVHHMERLTRHAVRRIRDARKFPAMGARRVKAIHPWSEPNTLREDGGSPSYCFKFGPRHVEGSDLEVHGALEVRGFRGGFTETRLRRLDGDHDALYPFGTYGPRRFHGDPVEAQPHVGALVTRPGPTYADVVDELQQRGARARDRDEAHGVVDEVREAFDEDVEGLVNEEPPLRSTSSSSRDASTSGQTATEQTVTESDGAAASDATDDTDREDGDVHVRRRRDRKPPARAGEARRVIELRDRRQGRPQDDPGHGGSDPPS